MSSATFGIGVGGTINRCYPFYLKFSECVNAEHDPIVMCRDEFEDYDECYRRRKERRLNFRIKNEMHKYKVLAIPRYNELTDSFEPVTVPVDPEKYFS
jgi:hypothetical protein